MDFTLPMPSMTSLIVRLGCALACLPLLPALAAPDEALYGADKGYPVGTRGNWAQPGFMVGSFTAMEQIFSTRPVPAAGAVRELPPRPKAPDWPFVQPYLDSHPVTGLLVIKDGQVLLERYQYGRSAQDRFTSFSMAKTVVGMATGVAIAEGKIASLDDPVEKYEPALAGSAWQGVPLRNVLNMDSGVHFDETYDRLDTDISRLSAPWIRQRGAIVEALASFKERDQAPGAAFKYVSANTQVLGQVLVKATGQPLAEYVGQKIWGAMGAEADAAWVVDPTGMEAAYCCLSARLRDWGRVGLLLLDQGQRDGRNILPKDWVEAATTASRLAPHLRPRRATPYFGYSNQIWVFPDDLGFALLGVRGQAVYVNPRLRLVMVQTAVWTHSSDPALGRQRDAFWRELIKAAGRL